MLIFKRGWWASCDVAHLAPAQPALRLRVGWERPGERAFHHVKSPGGDEALMTARWWPGAGGATSATLAYSDSQGWPRPASEPGLVAVGGSVAGEVFAGGDAQLGVDVGQVGLDGAPGDEQLLPDLRVGQPFRGQAGL